jgi:CheY-like chemotaxis protein
MNGGQLAATIKARVPTQPVLLLTGYGEAVQNRPSLLKGLDGIISKPFRIETLREAIARALPAKGLPAGQVQMDLFARDSTIRL